MEAEPLSAEMEPGTKSKSAAMVVLTNASPANCVAAGVNWPKIVLYIGVKSAPFSVVYNPAF